MSNLLARLFSGLTQEGITLPNGDFQSATQAQNIAPDFTMDSLTPAPQQSTARTPSFVQASHTGPGGTPNALSPQLSTKGKILTTILQAAAGGLAGSGERSAAGGFQQGMQLPFMQAQMRQQAQKGQMENELMQQQIQYAPLLRMLGIQKSQADIGKSNAEATKANAEAGAIPAKTALEQAQAEAANYKEDSNLGLIDLRTKQPVNPQGFAPLTAEEAQVLGKQPGERVPLKVKNTASEIAARGYTTLNTEEGVFDYNRLTKEKTKVGNNPRNVFAPEMRFVPVARDPNNPGYITYERAGVAAKEGAQAPASAQVQAAKAVAKSEVPTKAGDLKISFNTAIDHADLLRAAAKALNNGDQQTLAGLKNSFKNEFGSAGPITAQAIADAYGNEVTSMLAKGHMTDAEVGKVGKTLNPNKQNYSTIDSVLGAYQALAKSKLKNLNNQEKAAISGTGGAPKEIHYKIVNGQLVPQ